MNKSGKGGNHQRKVKSTSKEPRKLHLKELGQVICMLGNGRLEALCMDGKTRMCHIRGQVNKKIWINVGDIILLSLRDFQDSVVDVIDEVRKLRVYNEISQPITTGEAY